MQFERDVRAKGPEAFKEYFQGALVTARQVYAENSGADLPGWHWVGCDACEKWRLVTGRMGWGPHWIRQTSSWRASKVGVR